MIDDPKTQDADASPVRQAGRGKNKRRRKRRARQRQGKDKKKKNGGQRMPWGKVIMESGSPSPSAEDGSASSSSENGAIPLHTSSTYAVLAVHSIWQFEGLSKQF